MNQILKSIVKVIKSCDSWYKVMGLLIICITIVVCIIILK